MIKKYNFLNNILAKNPKTIEIDATADIKCSRSLNYSIYLPYSAF